MHYFIEKKCNIDQKKFEFSDKSMFFLGDCGVVLPNN